jgi:hypothetical protein
MIPVAIQLYIPLELELRYKKFIALLLGGVVHRPRKVSYDSTGFVMEFSLKNDKQVKTKIAWVTRRYQWWFMSAKFTADSFVTKKALDSNTHKELSQAFDKTELRVL